MRSACVRPRTLDAALRALADDPSLVPVAGCTDLMAGGRERPERLNRVLDLLGIAELTGVRRAGDALEIGAATTFSALRQSLDVQRDFPMLADAAGRIGGWQIQARATLGGNIANASPAGDALPVLLALDAVVLVAGAGGAREMPYADFHTGYRRTALRQGEVLVQVRLPVPARGTVQRFRKVGTREAQAISKIVVAMAARAEEGRLASIRFGAGSVAATPVRLRATEAALQGATLDAAAATLAAETAAGEVTPIDDVRSDARYRRFALANVVRRMVGELAP